MDKNEQVINANLIQATIFEDQKIIEKLIKFGADITQGALYQALYFNDMTTLNFLLETDKKYQNFFQRNHGESILKELIEPLAKHDNMQAIILLDKYGFEEKLENYYRDKSQLFHQTFMYFSSNTLGYLLEKFNILKDYDSLSPMMEGFKSFVENQSNHNYKDRTFDETKYHHFLQIIYEHHPDVCQQLMLSAIGSDIGKIFNTHSYDVNYLKGFMLYGIEPLKKLSDYVIKPLPEFDYQRLVVESFEKKDNHCMDLFANSTEAIEKTFLDMSLSSQNIKKANTLKI